MSLASWAGTAGISLFCVFLFWGTYSFLTEEKEVPEKKARIFKYLGWGGILVAIVAIFSFFTKIYGP